MTFSLRSREGSVRFDAHPRIDAVRRLADILRRVLRRPTPALPGRRRIAARTVSR